MRSGTEFILSFDDIINNNIALQAFQGSTLYIFIITITISSFQVERHIFFRLFCDLYVKFVHDC